MKPFLNYLELDWIKKKVGFLFANPVLKKENQKAYFINTAVLGN
mgnify:CR=1 FL=1